MVSDRQSEDGGRETEGGGWTRKAWRKIRAVNALSQTPSDTAQNVRGTSPNSLNTPEDLSERCQNSTAASPPAPTAAPRAQVAVLHELCSAHSACGDHGAAAAAGERALDTVTQVPAATHSVAARDQNTPIMK